MNDASAAELGTDTNASGNAVTLPTIEVHVALRDPIAGARVDLQLDRFEIDGGFTVPHEIIGTTDANGECTLSVWPNERGSRGSSYRVRIIAGNELIVSGTAAFPAHAGPCDLHAYLETPPFPSRDAYTDALISAADRAAMRAAAAVADSGQSGAALYLHAAAALNGHRVIATDAAGDAVLADIDDADTAFAAVGVCVDAAQPGDLLQIYQSGERITSAGWQWTPGRPVFLARQGGLSHDAGDGDFILQVGVAQTTTTLRVGIAVPFFNNEVSIR